jgi:hypothetical protein
MSQLGQPFLLIPGRAERLVELMHKGPMLAAVRRVDQLQTVLVTDTMWPMPWTHPRRNVSSGAAGGSQNQQETEQKNRPMGSKFHED